MVKTKAESGCATQLIDQLAPDLRAAVKAEIEHQVARRVDDQMIAYRRMLELAQEGGRVGVFEVDMKSGRSTGSAMWVKLLGQPEGTEVIDSRMWRNTLHPDDRDRVLEAVALSAKMGCDTALDYRIVLPDGGLRWLHSRNLVEQAELGQSSRAYGTLQDITDRKLLEAQILHSANHDSMTGLPNRRRFMEALVQAFDEGFDRQDHVALALFDLDHLKPTNDAHGHEAGDVLLKFSAGQLNSVATRAGLAARIGGDEFALLLKGDDAPRLRELAQVSLGQMRQPVSFGNVELRSTASAGGAIAAARSSSPELLLRAADMALYAAKRDARGRYRQAP